MQSHGFQRCGKGHHLCLVKQLFAFTGNADLVGEGTACKSEFSSEVTEKYTNNSVSGGIYVFLGQWQTWM